MAILPCPPHVKIGLVAVCTLHFVATPQKTPNFGTLGHPQKEKSHLWVETNKPSLEKLLETKICTSLQNVRRLLAQVFDLLKFSIFSRIFSNQGQIYSHGHSYVQVESFKTIGGFII